MAVTGTVCRACGARVIGRVHVEREPDPSLFIETYACGSIVAWGYLRKAGDPVLRECPAQTRSMSAAKE